MTDKLIVNWDEYNQTVEINENLLSTILCQCTTELN